MLGGASHLALWPHAGSGSADKAAVGLAAAMEEDRNAYSAQRAHDAAERKNWRAEQRDTLDELLPKATAGRCRLCMPSAPVLASGA